MDREPITIRMAGQGDREFLRGLPVRLRVMKVNPRALAFYERPGYARIGETGTHQRLEKIVTPR